MSDGHAHELRELADDEPNEPTAAWIEYADGTRLDLVLTRTAPNAWTAAPHGGATAQVRDGDHLRVDRLGPGCPVTFENVVRVGHTPHAE